MTKPCSVSLKNPNPKSYKTPRKKVLFKTVDYLLLILFLIGFIKQLIG